MNCIFLCEMASEAALKKNESTQKIGAHFLPLGGHPSLSLFHPSHYIFSG